MKIESSVLASHAASHAKGSTELRLTVTAGELRVIGGNLYTQTVTHVDVDTASTGEPFDVIVPAKLFTDIVRALPAGVVNLDADPTALTVAAGESEFKISVNEWEPFDVIVPAKLFTDIVRALPAGVVNLDADPTALTVAAGESEFKISVNEWAGARTLSSSRSVLDGGATVTVDGPSFRRLLNQTVVAASTDQNRPVLCGILVEPTETGVTVAATDSYRLAVASADGVGVPGGTRVLLPASVVGILDVFTGDGPLEVTVDRSSIVFTQDRTTVTTALVSGSFPDYTGLIPSKSDTVCLVDVDGLAAAVRRAELVTSSGQVPVRLAFHADRIVVSTQRPDVAASTESVQVEWETGPPEAILVDPLVVGFTPAYLLDGLKMMGTPEGFKVPFWLNGSLKPAVLVDPTRTDHRYLLMPVPLS